MWPSSILARTAPVCRRDEKSEFEALIGRIDYTKGRGGA